MAYSTMVDRVMRSIYPEGFVYRDVRNKKKTITRIALCSVGPHDEWSIDGHEKLAEAGFAIYGIRDKWGGGYLQYSVLPSARFASVCLVIYLRCIKKFGGRLTLS
jgi:hypothetical protein